MTRLRRLGISVMAGSVVTALPWIFSKIAALWFLFLLKYPGAFVAWEISGDIYNYNHLILVFANVAFYSSIVYACWALRTPEEPN
jgi:hypothetical protein